MVYSCGNDKILWISFIIDKKVINTEITGALKYIQNSPPYKKFCKGFCRLWLSGLFFAAGQYAAACSAPMFLDGGFIILWGSFGTDSGRFNSPFGIAADAKGNVYVADSYNNRIQKFTTAGTFITTWGEEGSGNGQFVTPFAVEASFWGKFVYVGDNGNDRVQKFRKRYVPKIIDLQP